MQQARGVLVLVVVAIAGLVVASAAARTAAKPNLRVTSITLGSKSVAAGAKLSATEATTNSGARRAAKSVTAYFLSADARKDARDVRIGSRAVPALPAKKSSKKPVVLLVPAAQPAGGFRLIACADDKRKLKETSERDNCRTSAAAVVVTRPVPPDPPAPAPTTTPPPPSPTDPGGTPTPTPTDPGETTPDPAIASAQITSIRSAPDGSANLPVTGAVVTYLKPALGSDPAGFFVQAAKAGPALFVAVNPIGLIPAPAVGDRVSFTVTEMNTVGGLREATALSGFSRTATGVDVSTLRNDVTASADLVSELGSYESELVTLVATVAGGFTTAGTGHVQARIDTTGLPGSPDLRLRIPTTLRDTLELVQGCAVRLESGPMWRFGSVAQPSAYSLSDLTVMSCPAPQVVSAVATSPTAVTVTFDRQIDPVTVASNGSQFTADNGLTFSAASGTGTTVTLTSTAQVAGTAYTVMVAGTVQDLLGNGVNPAVNSAVFEGFIQKAVLRLDEINPNITGSHDLIELTAVTDGTLSGITIEQAATATDTLVTMPSVVVQAGDLIVVHLVPTGTPGIAPASETTSKAQFPAVSNSANYDTAWDILGGPTGLTFGYRVVRVLGPLGSIQDGIPFYTTAGTPPTGFPTALQSLQAAGQWSPANCGGQLCTYVSTPTAESISVLYDSAGTTATGNSIQRKAGLDANQASDWNAAAAQTFGVPNA